MKKHWRLLLVAAILAVMALDVGTYLRWRAERSVIADLAASLGLDKTDPKAVEEALKDPDSILARVWLARSLYRQVNDAIGDAQRRDELIASLESVVEVADWVWQRRPVHCEAAALSGSARYLSWLLAEDVRLVTEAKAWETPLLAARRLCGQDPSHANFLGSAYLELWLNLSDEKREVAKEIVAEALEQSDHLVFPWLATAPTREEAWAVLPPRPSLWSRVQDHYLDRGEWLSAIEAREHWETVLVEAASSAIAEARKAESRGKREVARALLSRSVFQTLPRNASHGDLVLEALEVWPENPNPGRQERVLAPWLSWSLEACRMAECPLPGEAISRLASLIPDFPPAHRAQAHLVAGRRAEAEVLEPAMGDPAAEEGAWQAYWLAKARLLAEKGDVTTGLETLDRLPPGIRSTPLVWWIETLDPSLAISRPEAFRLGPWTASGSYWVQDLAVQTELTGMTLALPEVLTLLEVELDGQRIGPFPPNFGQTLDLPPTFGPGPHRIVLRSIDGQKIPAPRTEIKSP